MVEEDLNPISDEEKDFYMIEFLRKQRQAKGDNITHIELKSMLTAMRNGGSFTTSTYAPCMKCKRVTNTFFPIGGTLLLCKSCYLKSKE